MGNDLEIQRIALARTIADQAQAIVDGTVVGPEWSAVKRLRDNADMLLAWTPDHRGVTPRK